MPPGLTCEWRSRNFVISGLASQNLLVCIHLLRLQLSRRMCGRKKGRGGGGWASGRGRKVRECYKSRIVRREDWSSFAIESPARPTNLNKNGGGRDGVSSCDGCALAIVSSHTYVMRDRYLWWVLSLFWHLPPSHLCPTAIISVFPPIPKWKSA